MTTLVNSFEGGTNGTTITQGGGGNSGPGSGNFFDGVSIGTGAACTYDNTHGGAHGSLAAHVTTGGTAAASYVLWSTSLGSSTQVWFRQYLYFAALPPGSCTVLLSTNSGNTVTCAYIVVNSAGHLIINNSASSGIYTSTTVIPTGQWFRIEGFILGDPSVGQVGLQIYTVPDGTVPAETFTSAATQNTGAAIGRFAFGVYFSASNESYWQDDLGLSTTGYLGPVVTPLYVPSQAGVVPPGLQSPASFPVVPYGLPNEPATGVPQPYYAGQGQSPGTTNHVTASVTRPTGKGDALVVMVDYYSTLGAVVSCTDTQGNSYSIGPPAFAGNDAVLACVAQNTAPLSPASSDSVTVTFANTVSPPVSPQVFLTGCAAGAVSSAPGGSWLTVTDSKSLAEGGGGSLNITSSGVISGPAVILGCTSSTSSGVTLWPQNWTVLGSNTAAGYYATSVAARVTSAPIPVGTPVLSVQSPSTAASVSGVYVVLQLETRFASQAGLMPGSQASPPGLMSPGAWPVFPLEIGEINDAPPVTPQPYYIGSASSVANSAVITVPAQNPVNRGDAIVVALAYRSNQAPVVSCTDTQGNAYSLVQNETAVQPWIAVYVAQNAVPLTAADSVTFTLAAAAASSKQAIVMGVPAGSVLTPPGGSWLTYGTGSTGSGNQGAVTLTAPVATLGPLMAVAFGSSASAAGVFQFPQNWSVVRTLATGVNGQDWLVAAFLLKGAPGIPANSQVLQGQVAVSAQNLTAAYVPLAIENRVAPNRPVPDMPPGMLSPGAWQYAPGIFPEGPAGTRYNPGPNKWTEALPATSRSVPALTRSAGKPASGVTVSHSAVIKSAGKGLRSTLHSSSSLRKAAGKVFGGTVHFVGALTRARQAGKQLASVVRGTAGIVHSFAVLLPARAAAVAHLVFPGRVPVFSVPGARVRWRVGSARNHQEAPMGMLTQSVLSTVMVQVQVNATLNGAPYDPTGDAVLLAFIPQQVVPVNPGSGDWHSASWQTDNPSTGRAAYWAGCLIGPGNGGLALPVGTYVIWVMVTDGQEIPVLSGQYLNIV